MAAKVSMSHRDAYLFVHIQGDPLTPEERRSTAAKVLDEIADGNLDIVYHEDTHGVQPPSAWDYIARANFIATSDSRQRIAYVPPKQMPPEKIEFAQNVAKNQGLMVRVFACVEDAIQWVESSQDDTD